MILITGGGGFLGLNIARHLLEKGQEVLLVQRHTIQPHPILTPYWDRRVKQAAGNVLDWPFLFGLVKQYPVESIIHGAFDTGTVTKPETMKNSLPQLVQVELEGSKNILEVARNAGLRRVTFISSVDCYRGWPHECEVWHEDAFLPPVSFSPISNCKRATEQIGFLYSKTYGISFVALRVGRVYGPAASHPDPIRIMVETTTADKPADLSKVPESTRGHTVYAKDVGEATSLIHLAKSLQHYIYNVSDGTHPTMLEVAQVIRDFIPNAKITLGPAGQEKPLHSGVDVKRMKEEFGFVFRDLKTGIKDYITWLKSGHY
jgi:UDP-glucose 4-epimerase/UDP-glucuronate 4-epimerase